MVLCHGQLDILVVFGGRKYHCDRAQTRKLQGGIIIMAQARRKDKARTVLRKGEGQRSNGTYYYRWQDKKGNRHYLYAKSLQDLREQEKQVEKDKYDGIKAEARYTTVNDLYELWKQP